MDFSQLLLAKTDTIAETWVEAVRQDRQIESAAELSYTAVRNQMPHVLKAMATVLSQTQDDDVKSLVQASLDHGVHRAEQGYDPAEIAREYRLLRSVIFAALDTELLQAPSAQVIRVFRRIDAVIDEAIACCFQSYSEERLREFKQLQSQLTLTNQELTRLVRANQDNLSHLAHELKNPLNSIIGYSELFLRQNRENTDLKDTLINLEHIERVCRNGRHLLRLLNDTLEISRYEAGKMQLQPKVIDPRSLIKDVREMLAPLAEQKQLQILVDCTRAPEEVRTDPLRLQQIVTNLVSNAIRYTQSGTIQVACQFVADNQWAIAFSDTGIGIEPQYQAHIFDPYFQITSSSTNSDSNGLGLAIVSRLVKLLQGKIELVSQVGVGSTFTVILPLAVKTTEEAVTAIATQVGA